jgi:hypothetical protein
MLSQATQISDDRTGGYPGWSAQVESAFEPRREDNSLRPGDKPTFLPETCFAIRYAKEGQAMIGVFDETLNRLFPSRKAKTTFTKALIKVGAIQNGHGHAGTVQERLPVVIRGETIDRPRFWPFDAGQFIALCARA